MSGTVDKNQSPPVHVAGCQPVSSASPKLARAIELLEWIEDYALADADLGEVASRAGEALINLEEGRSDGGEGSRNRALDALLYNLEPFLAAAAVVVERPHEYQPTVARIGGISNARDLRVEDFQRLLSARAALSATSPTLPVGGSPSTDSEGA